MHYVNLKHNNNNYIIIPINFNFRRESFLCASEKVVLSHGEELFFSIEVSGKPIFK